MKLITEGFWDAIERAICLYYSKGIQTKKQTTKTPPAFSLLIVLQSQTSILEKISHHDLQKFGSLVSAVITKSWPRSKGQAVDDLDDVLKHLLTWPDVKHLFKLYGMSVAGTGCVCSHLLVSS